jgi:diguanylate cyclase (GGDEF)-like protein/PAS domain S-box-containing protein
MLSRTEREDPALIPIILVSHWPVPQQTEVLADTMSDLNLYRRLLGDSSDPIFCFDPDCRYLYANQAYADGIRRNLDEIIGLTVWDVFAKDEADTRSTLVNWVFDHGETKTHEMLVQGRNGERHYLTTVTPIFGDRGRVLCVLANSKDITERKLAELVLKASEEKYRALVETTGTGHLTLDKDGKVIDANAEYVRLTGYSELREILGRSVLEWTAEYEIERNNKAVGQCTRDGFIRNLIIDYVDRHGRTTPIEINATVIGEGDSVQLISLCRDITERKDQEAQLMALAATLRDREAHYRLLTENVLDVVWQQDRDSRFTYISPADERLRGYRSDEVIGHHAFELMTSDGIALATEIGQQLSASEPNGVQTRPATFEVQQHCKDGSLVWTEIHSMPEHDSTGAIAGFHGITRDITERKRVQDQVRQLAFYDPLTQLPNRRLLNDRLSQTMSVSKRSVSYAALLMLDLDNFKPLNDAHGHQAGDLLLVEVARRLTECVRETDTVARVGGDEFVVVLGELNADPKESARQAAEVAEKIRASLAAPYRLVLDGGSLAGAVVEYRCSASIGAVLFLNHEVSQEDLMKQADSAMYRAKEVGRNAVRFYGLPQ